MDKDKGSCSATPAAAEGSCGTKTDCGTQKGKCCGKAIMGAFLGGLVMYAWFSLSWMLIPWHANSLMAFKDEAAVAKVISANAPDSGVYVLPFTNMGKDEQKTEKPFAFVSVLSEGVNVKATMPCTMAEALGASILMAFFLSCLLSKKVEGFCPVAFSLKTGLLVGLAGFLPMMIWYHFPLSWTLTGIADDVIAFGLAGAAIGRCVFKMKMGMCPASACGPAKGACGTDKTDKGSCSVTDNTDKKDKK